MRFWSSSPALRDVREPANSFASETGVEVGRQRFGAEPLQPRVVAERPARRQIHEAEPSRVVVDDGATVIEGEHHVVVLGIFRALVKEFAGR